MEPQPVPSSELHDFVDFLFEGLEGIAYVATKDPNDVSNWGQHFFNIPAERQYLEDNVLLLSKSHEVYLAPVLYSEPKAIKENFHASNVVWTEFDGNAPTEASYLNVPSYRVQSSSNENQHVYWKLSTPILDVENLEKINRTITYAMSADSSAWDATQVLRPPTTYNHKRDLPVSVLSNSNFAYDISIFESLPSPPDALDVHTWELGVLPDLTTTILKYPFPKNIAALFQKEVAVGARSTGLMQLAHACCEMGMKDAEVFVVLHNADERWEKFKGRKDQHKRLAHIITIARAKHPAAEGEGDNLSDAIFMFDFVQFLNTDIEIDWVVEPMLMENGSMLLVGPSGVGKTQLSLRFAIAIALGKPYLHYKITTPRRILFLSLEMGHGSLKIFLKQMAATLTADELALLQQNFIVIPHGEKWALNTPVGQAALVTVLNEFDPPIAGIFIDSIGSALHGSISADEPVQDLLDFNDHIIKKFDLFLWYIHHMRKSTNGGHQPASQDDVYGNQFLVNRSSSNYAVLRHRDGTLKVRNFKNRLAEREEDYVIKRTTTGLDFEPTTLAPVVKGPKVISYQAPDGSKGPSDLQKGL